jgi:hypothetical protein
MKELILSTGKKIYANHDIVGLAVHDDKFYLTSGYDSYLESDLDEYESFTRDEKIEIADYQIALWTRYKNQLSETKEADETRADLSVW